MARTNNSGGKSYSNKKEIATGNLVSDPKVISGKGRDLAVVLRVAVDSVSVDNRDGTVTELVTFRDIKLFKFHAQGALDNLSKGDRIKYEGPLFPKPAFTKNDGTLVENDEEVLCYDGVTKVLFADNNDSGRSRGRDEDEDQTPTRSRGRSRSRSRDEDDEDEPAPSRSRSRSRGRDEEDEDEPAPSRSRSRSRGRDEEDEDEPAPRGRGRSRSRDEDDEDDGDSLGLEDAPAPSRSRGRKKVETEGDDIADYANAIL